MKQEMIQKKSTFNQLDEELLEFHKYLKRKNFDDDEIYKIFKPLLKEKKQTMRKFIFAMIFVFIILKLLMKTQIGWWYILSISRMFLVQIKPFYDWSHLKNQDCLVPKWWQEEIRGNYTPNCNFCENLRTIDVLKYLDKEKLEELYIEVQKPVILTHGGFPTADHLWSSFLQDNDYLSSIPCSLETNLMEKDENVGKIFRKMTLFDDFFVHFQNCDYQSMKYFRKIVPMPDSSPKHISPVQYNWLMWSKNYEFPAFKEIDLVDSENVKLIGQVDGEVMYRLSPPEMCSKTCGDVQVKLQKGQALFFTSFWSLAYKITDSDPDIEHVGVILEAHSIL